MNIETLRPQLEAISSWNSFAKSLCEQIDRKGELSDKQFAACEKMLEKLTNGADARAKKSGAVDMTGIETLFATARSNGLKRLAFVAADLRITPAAEKSRNAGGFYVKNGDAYQGKIVGGKFIASGECADDTLAILSEIAADPAGQARLYGKRTGICCCCGRELTDPESIAAGIGPVCATKWGL